MFRSVRAQLTAIFFAYALLVVGASLTTFLYTQNHADDEAIGNIAYDLRTIVYRTTSLVLTELDNPNLTNDIQHVEQNLQSLLSGGAVTTAEGNTIVLRPVHNLAIIIDTDIEALVQSWANYKNQLELVSTLRQSDPAYRQALLTLQVDATEVINLAEALSSKLENHQKQDHLFLMYFQVAFLALTAPLIALGYYLIQSRVVRPLADLNVSAQRIKTGDLSRAVLAANEDEVGELAHSLEEMRAEIAASQKLLETRVANRTRELMITLELTQQLVRQLDFPQLSKFVTTSAQALTQAKGAFLCLLTPDEKCVQLAAHSRGPLPGHNMRQPADHVLEVVANGQAIDTQVENSTCIFLKFASSPSDHCFAVPLLIGGRILGSLCVLSDQHSPFSQEKKLALTLLANSAAIAISNTRLIKAGEQQAKRTAKLNERQRLATELHDYLAQTLSLLRLQAGQVESMLVANQIADAYAQLERLRSNVDTASVQMRAAISNLSTKPIKGAPDLREEIEAVIENFREVTGIYADFSFADPSWKELPSLSQKQILLIAREALANIRRHAQAKSVRVYVEHSGDDVCLQVEDDGIGFDPQLIMGDNHVGLKIMRERAQRSGGLLTINSAPGSGTKVVARLPLRKSPGSAL